MSKSRSRLSLFNTGSKKRVSVEVEGAPVEMTKTQAYRFDELKQNRLRDTAGGERGLFDEDYYSFADASMRMMVDERELLTRAAEGKVRVYADIGGAEGHWRSYGSNGDARESSPLVLQSGFLALTVQSSREILDKGESTVAVFEYACPQNLASLGINADALAAIANWGDCARFFCLSSPRPVRTDDLVLFPPLRA